MNACNCFQNGLNDVCGFCRLHKFGNVKGNG